MEIIIGLSYVLGNLVWLLLIVAAYLITLFVLTLPHEDREDWKVRILFTLAIIIIVTPFIFESVIHTEYVFNKDGAYEGTVAKTFWLQKSYNKLCREKIVIANSQATSELGEQFVVNVGTNVQAAIAWRYQGRSQADAFFIIKTALNLGTYAKGERTIENIVRATSKPELEALINETSFNHDPDIWTWEQEDAEITVLVLKRLGPRMKEYFAQPIGVTITRKK